jgi:VCBS repeat-containing protein
LVLVDIADIGGSSAIASSTAQVAPHVNQAPVAIDDSYAAVENISLDLFAPHGVLANDTDAEQDTLGAVLVTGPMHGSVTLNPDGSFRYTPAADFHGTDGFTYQANEASANSNVASVSITVRSVNQPPVANDDAATTNEEAPVLIDVLANDTGRDGAINPPTVGFTRLPLHGNVRADAITGAITYKPVANFFGPDSFGYKVRDNNGLLSNEAIVSITVNHVNHAPVGVNDHYATTEEATLEIAAAGSVLANDTDADGEHLTAVLLSQPAYGALSLHSDGTFSYTPAAEFFGIDSFRYEASDGISTSAAATVSLTILPVNHVPVIAPLADRAIDQGSRFTGSGSFRDPDPDDSWTATVNYGDGTGDQPLMLAGKDFALDHVYLKGKQYDATVKVTDASGASGSATFKVTVRNLAATVNAGTDKAINEGDLVTILGSFTDPGLLDTHTATINWGDGTATEALPVTEAGGAGTVVASHTYADDNVYIATVTVTDDEGASSSDTLTVSVANVPPRVEAGVDRTIDAGESITLPALFTTEVPNAAFGRVAFQSVAGSLVDPGAFDSHTATIDWGDGTVETAPLEEHTFAPLGSPAEISGAVRGTHLYASGGNFRVLITVTDNAGGVGSASFMVAVNSDTDPTATFSDSGPVSEGSTATVSFTNPSEPSGLKYSYDFDNDGVFDITDSDSPTATVPTNFLTDGPGTHIVAGRIANATGHTDYTTAINITNAPPGAAVVGPTNGVFGQTLSYSFQAGDPSPVDQAAGFTFSIDWGDGSALQTIARSPGNGAGAPADHVFAGVGPFVVQVTATDKDGGISAAQTLTVTIDKATATATTTLSANAIIYGQSVVFAAALQAAAPGAGIPGGSVRFYDGTALLDTEALDAQGRAASVPISSLGAGNHSITVSYLGDGHFNPNAFVAPVLTIARAHLTVRANDASRVYGDPTPSLTAGMTGFQNGETLATSGVTGVPSLTTVAANSHVGAYAITVAAGSLSAANYDFPAGNLVNGTLTVTPAPLTITADNKTKLYGASLPSLTASYQGFVNGDTPASLTTAVSLSTTATASSHVGSFAITAAGGIDADYTIQFGNGTLTVTPASLTITADDKVKVFGAPLPALTASYRGFVNGDTPASLTVQPYLSTAATTNSPVGTYPITVGGAVDRDYSIRYVNGTLTITTALTNGIILLDPSGKGSLTDSGNGKVVVNGGSIIIDSSNSAAAVISGNGSITAAEFDITGAPGLSTSGKGSFQGVVHNGVAPTADPYASLAAPALPSTTFAAVNYSGKSPLTLNPGKYVGGIHLSGQAFVTLNPGIYYLQGGGLTISGQVQVTGNGVLIYNAAKNTTDSVRITGQGNVTLSAPVSGTYRGIVLFQDRIATVPLDITGNGGTRIEGIIYAARATVTLTGNGGLDARGNPVDVIGSQLVCYDLRVTGNGSFAINAGAASEDSSINVTGGGSPRPSQVAGEGDLEQYFFDNRTDQRRDLHQSDTWLTQDSRQAAVDALMAEYVTGSDPVTDWPGSKISSKPGSSVTMDDLPFWALVDFTNNRVELSTPAPK